jgi:hypothetical protein
MSSQRFDKILKEKLESFPVAEDAGAWRRIRAKMPVPFWVLWLKSYGVAAYMVLSLGALGWLAWQTGEVSTRNLQMESKLREQEIAFRGIRTELQRVQTRAANQELKLREAVASSGSSLTNPSFNPNSGQMISSGGNLSAPSGSGGFKAGRNRDRDLSLKETARANPDPRSVAYANPVPVPEESRPDALAQIQSPGNATVEKPMIKDSTVQKTAEPSVVKVDSLKKESVKEKQAPSRFLVSLRPRIGAELATNFNDLTGAGLSAEFLVARNLGISLGVIGYQPVRNEFIDTYEFNSKTHKDFRKEYSDNVSGLQGDIREITLKTSLIELPIRFKYYYPVHARWNLLFSAGTHLNVSVRQDIRCETHEDNREVYHTFIHRPSAQMFHNFVFSTGIQYEKQNFLLQLAPYYQFNFREIEYLDRPSIFGISGSVWFRLKD